MTRIDHRRDGEAVQRRGSGGMIYREVGPGRSNPNSTGMAPTTTHQGGEASSSRSSARRRRRRALARRPSPTAVSRVAQSEAAPSSSQRGKRKRRRAAKEEQSRAADKIREEEEEEEENAARRTAERNTGDLEAAAASASGAAEQAASSEASSAVSSPIRWPYRPSVVIRPGVEIMEPVDSEFAAAYEELVSKYHEKIRRQQKLPTLDQRVPLSCLVSQNLLPIRDSATRIVRKAAKAVLGLSSYTDGKLLKRSSGFLIDWNDDNKACTILTSALLICSKSQSLGEWLGTDEYVPNAEVRVHLLDKDETTVVARLLHYDKHFNLALFKVDVDVCAQIPCFSSKVVFGQEAFVLGRDESLYLNINHGSVQYKGPSIFERHHYMFINCGIGQCGAGGPVIDFDGQVLGMASIQGMGFIPSSIILKCLHMWKKFHYIPRLHVGMKFSAIKFLDPAHVENISRKCNVDEGLIVTEVSGRSVAEKLGVRTGDIIECLNGECIATTVELENYLMSICEDHLDKRRGIGSNLDIPVDIFHTRKGSRSTINLKARVSYDIEVVQKGTCLVSARDCA